MTKKLTQECFIKRCSDRFTVLGEYINSDTSVLVKCKKCGKEFSMPAKSILNGRGCRYCANNVAKTTKSVQEEVDNLYGSGVFRILSPYQDNHSPLSIKHIPTETIFTQSRSHLLEGYNIPDYPVKTIKNVVGGRGVHEYKGKMYHAPIPSPQDKTKEFQKKLTEKYGTRFTVLGTYVDSKTKIEYQCSVCGQHNFAIPSDLLQYGSCKTCSSFTESTGEQLIYGLLQSNGISFEYHKPIKVPGNKHKMHLDFYIPEKKLAIEFDGVQHYDMTTGWYSKEGKKRDLLKDQWAVSSGITLIRLRDYSPKALLSSLVPYFGNLDNTELVKAGAGQTPIKEIYDYSKAHTYTATSEKYHIYYTKLYDIIELYSGKRPVINHPKVTDNDSFLRALNDKWGKRFIPKESYQGLRKKILIHCNQCKQDFYTIPGTLLSSKRESGGCPYCAHNIRWNLSMIKRVLPKLYPLPGFNEGQYTILDTEFTNSHKKMLVKCNKCGKVNQLSWHELKLAHGCYCSSLRFGDGSNKKQLVAYANSVPYKF